MKKNYCKSKRLVALGLILLLLVSYAPSALAESFSAIVTSSSMAVYKQASLSTKVGTLKRNTVVTVSDYSSSVARLSYNGYTVYAKTSNLKAVKDVGLEAVVNTTTYAYKSANAKSDKGSLKKGTKLYVLAVENGWAYVEKDGVVAYTYAKYLTKAEDVAVATKTATPSTKDATKCTVVVTKLPVYKKASTDASKIGHVYKGQEVNVIKYNSTWAYIEVGGYYGYCATKGVLKNSLISTATPTPTATPSIENATKCTVVVTKLPVYKKASTGASKIGHIYKGKEVNVIKYNSTWAYIEVDGYYGYCATKGVLKNSLISTATPTPTATPSTEDATKCTVVVTKLPVYKKASTDSSLIGHIYKGKEVNVIKYNSTWAYIEVDGYYGYCATKGVLKNSLISSATPTPTATPSTENATECTVIVAKLPVYKLATTSSSLIGHIYKGKEVNVIKYNSKWAYIEVGGYYGYCATKGLLKNSLLNTPSPTPSLEDAIDCTVTVTKLPVYKSASTNASLIGHIYKGQKVNVLKYNSTWAYVEVGGYYGYCGTKGLIKSENFQTTAPTPTPSIENAVKAVVSASSVDTYKAASEKSTKLSTLKKGQEVNAISWNKEWAFIELNGYYGYCKVAALSKKSDLPSGYKKGGFTATVIYPDAKAYASDSTSSTSVNLNLGATVNVYAYSSDWACVTQDKIYAFVPVKQLSVTSYDTIDSSGSSLQVVLKALLSYGYYDLVPSTNYNTAATTAIKRFQNACGLSQTGVADQTMLRILLGGYAPKSSLLSSSLSSGNTGTNVGRMQTRLYALGYLSKTASVDSDYGTTTSNAVKLFQSANSISITGTANTATLKAMYSTGATSKPSNVKAADASGGSSSGGSSSYLKTMPSSVASFTTSYSSSMSSAEKLEYAIYVAQNQLTKPYVYGAEGPNKYDCSGFTQYCFKKIGISLKRSAYSQGYDSSYTKISSTSSLKRGDVVFFNTISDSDSCDHAGIYLGSGYFIHASSGGKMVVVSNLNSGYYNRVFSWGRRII